MIITAVGMADDGRDDPQLAPMIEQAEKTMGTKSEMTLADAAYHSGKGFGRMRSQRPVSCDAGDATTAAWGPVSQGPIHVRQAHRQLHVPAGAEAPVSSYPTLKWSPVASVPKPLKASARRAQPSESVRGPERFGRSVTIGPYDAALRHHRVWMSTDEAWVAYKRRKAVGRTSLRNHQGATGGSEIPAAWLRERVGRVDSVGHSIQPAHPVAGVEPRRLCRSTPSWPKASLRF